MERRRWRHCGGAIPLRADIGQLICDARTEGVRLAAGIPTVVTVSDYTGDEDFDGARMVLPPAQRFTLEQLQLWHASADLSNR